MHYLVHNPDFKPHPWTTWPLRPAYATDPIEYRRFYPLLRHGWHRGPWEPADSSASRLPRELNARFRWILNRLRPEIIWFQNLHGGASKGWSAELVEVASYFAPVVWTLHDMWSFTGRCAYNYDCRSFETGCTSQCPTADEYPRLDRELIPAAWEYRRRLLGSGRAIRAVAPSKWLAREAIQGAWPESKVDVIASAIPAEIYRPLDRNECRQKLGLPNDGRPLILVSAHNLSDRRKGGEFIPVIMSEMKTRPASILFMGQGSISIEGDGIEVFSLGFIDSEAKQAEVYNAADIMLHPAPVDNLPNVVIESLSCGTPVVSYPIGGVTELVIPGTTGWLAGSLTPKGLAQALDRACWQICDGRPMRDSCRQFALEHFDDQARATDYERLFEQICLTEPVLSPNQPFALPTRRRAG
jgi:glycosyltransferase involved in cell wall biosynthesis